MTITSPRLQPTYVYEAITFIEQVGFQLVFEWGAGQSTLYYNSIAECLTVEHSPKWLGRVATDCHDLGISANLLFRPAVNARQHDHQYSSTVYPGKQFAAYATAINHLSEFDLIAVDGRARIGCLKHAIEHVRPGGMLLLDNSERPRYAAASEIVPGNWQRNDFLGRGPHAGGQWQTTIWIKPIE